VAALAGGLLPATPDASPVRPRRGAETTTDDTTDHDDFYAAAHYRTANAAAARSAPSPASPARVPATELAKALSLAWEWQREAARLDDGLKDARRVIASLEAKVQAAQQAAVVAGIRQTIARENDTAVSPKSHAAAAHGAEAESTIARMLALADELRLGHLSCLMPHMKIATPVVVTLSRNALYLDESRTNDGAEDQLRTLLTIPLAELTAASISSSDAAAVDLETVDGKQARLLFADPTQASDFLTILQMRRDPASGATKPTSAPIAAGTGSGGKQTAVGEVTATTVFRPSAVHRLPRLTDDAAEDELLREVEALTAGAGFEMSSPRQQGDSGHPANRRSPMGAANTGKPQRVFDRLYDAKPLRGRQLEARQAYGRRPGSASPSQRSSSLPRRRSGSAGGRERDAVVVRGQSQSGLVVRSAAEAHPSEVAAYRALASSFYTNFTSTRQDEPTREDEGDQRRLLLEQWNRIFGPGSEAPGQRLKHHQGNRSHSGRGQNAAATPRTGTSGVNGGASSMHGREQLSAVSILGLDQLDAAPVGDVVAASNAILEQRRRQVRGASAAPVVGSANDSVPSSLMPMPSPIGRRPTVHRDAEFPSPSDARSSAPVLSGGARAVLPADVPPRTQAVIGSGSPPAAKAPPPPPPSLPPPTVPPPPPPPKKSVPPPPPPPPKKSVPPPPPPAKKSVPPPPPPPPKPRASASP
jgi:hypothetical protein